ncbi:hypothetical protein KY335_04720 [Candidatus Woesearchaeota archaeon]|nr:hypothetical protein [Candidatus Woesearchaeota archaeon]MBW3014511.1 hypothetical protein [Candidatus Woesearchaeota archaeon]
MALLKTLVYNLKNMKNERGELSLKALMIIIATLIGIFILAVLFFKSFKILK